MEPKDPEDGANQDAEFRARYNTELRKEDEAKYQQWVADRSKSDNRDRSKDEIDYDMRGAWKSGAATAENGHYPDTYKKPNHPTFSDQSQYHGAKDDSGVEQRGGRWVADEKGNPVAFEQSSTNAKHWPDWAIRDYLDKVEPGVKLRKTKD